MHITVTFNPSTQKLQLSGLISGLGVHVAVLARVSGDYQWQHLYTNVTHSCTNCSAIASLNLMDDTNHNKAANHINDLDNHYNGYSYVSDSGTSLSFSYKVRKYRGSSIYSFTRLDGDVITP